MKHGLALFALAASTCAFAAPPAERPNQPVFRSGPWVVVRSVRDGGKTVACNGFYSANRHVLLSKDALVVQAAEDVKSVALGFDGLPAGAQRPMAAAEKEPRSITLEGDDFARLSQSKRVRIDVETAQGTMRHELDLNGFAQALENIAKGCPVPEAPKTAKPQKRKRKHS